MGRFLVLWPMKHKPTGKFHTSYQYFVSPSQRRCPWIILHTEGVDKILIKKGTYSRSLVSSVFPNSFLSQSVIKLMVNFSKIFINLFVIRLIISGE